MGNKFTRKFKLGESKSKDSGATGQYANKAEDEAPEDNKKVNETGASSSVEDNSNQPAETKKDVNIQQVTIKIDEVGPNEPDADPPGLTSGESQPVESKQEVTQSGPESNQETSESKPESTDTKQESTESKPDSAEAKPESAEAKTESTESKSEANEGSQAEAKAETETSDSADTKPDDEVKIWCLKV